MRKIYLTVEKLFNNQIVLGSNDPIENFFFTNYCYSSSVLNRDINGDIENNEDIFKTFQESLQNEIDSLTSGLEKLITDINENQEKISSMNTNISNLENMIEASRNSTVCKTNVSEIVKNIKMRFKKEKSDLKEIITTLFADNLDIQDLIARIIEHHFTEGCDKYLQLENEDNITEHIELLRRTQLFEDSKI
ncbi:hypothetical protein Phum_PHUM475100 [Pediculus humanus corporis]|uniref:Uncharacterized protein n=1 Tax=Pediculus humanus subsp. corporis TaxID=121224 RepID=E0VW71_PEDHC|nr:uncharacterized protein Phum_PHUM475100 [Pediculus humanus corporis]EEB17627.1 hypothetical protein Phum_PHUM475100 [Pediculus humanus corporis]